MKSRLCPRHPRAIVAVLALTMLLVTGCGSPSRSSPYTAASESARDPAKAQRLTMEAADLLDEDPDKAEQLLREALAADLMHGPAHHNLGVAHLQRGDWYEAASEFEWARKLMPGHSDPRMNLALTFEKAGRISEALTTYQTALDVYPGHIPTIQAMTRLQVRSGQCDNQTRERLKVIALEGETHHWRAWAQERLALDPNADATQSPTNSAMP